MIFFTSDTHFGMQRTLELSRRPFKSINEMDETMINNWNNLVKKDDTIYHLGDFGNYDVVKQLNGNIVLIYGNYEEKDIETKFNNNKENFEQYLLNKGFKDVQPYLGFAYRTMVNKYIVYMAHEPSKLPKSFSDDSELHLFGHIHERQLVKTFGINVGMDCHHYKPITLDTILFYQRGIELYYDEEVFSV